MPNPLDLALHELVLANRILARQGVVDGFGHVSVRHPTESGRFLIARSMAPARVTEADIVDLDAHGEANDPSLRLYLERHIHAAILAARPDVGAVVHSHSPSVIPFAVVPDVPLRPVYHMAGFMGDAAPLYEIRDCAGHGSDMLIRTPELGADLATRLGDAPAILMRGHGSTVVAPTLRQAVYRAVYLEQNARLQSQALQLGTPIYLTAEEAAAAAAANDGQVDRPWDLWVEEVGPI